MAGRDIHTTCQAIHLGSLQLVDSGMDTLVALVERVTRTLAEFDVLSLTALPLPRRGEAVVTFGIIALLALGVLLTRFVARHRSGRTDIVLPANRLKSGVNQKPTLLTD